MNAFERLKEARHAGRPTGAAYVAALFENRLDLCGDRRFGEDPGHHFRHWHAQRPSRDLYRHRQGRGPRQPHAQPLRMPHAGGYRKALRLMKQAEKFHRPVICLVDTLGAYCGAEAEERGQGEAIAENILEMMGLRTPVISVVIGEGGSGGALALARPTACICWKTPFTPSFRRRAVPASSGRTPAAWRMPRSAWHITAADMVDLHVAEEIIPENFADFPQMCAAMTVQLTMDLDELCALSPEELLEQRYRRYRRIGVYEENGSIVRFTEH